MFGCSDIASCVSTYIGPSFDLAFAVIAIASTIAAITPTPADDRWVGKLYKLIDTLALNVGYAKDRSVTVGGRFVPD